MLRIDAATLATLLDDPSLIEAIAEAFRVDVTVPLRHHHTIPRADAPDATLLLMPAWRAGAHVGVKIAGVFPGNADHGLPAVQAAYLLLDGRTGAPLAQLDGPELTARRTASASALAARFLARPDASRLLMVGTGALASHLVRAHTAVRPIKQVRIWGRTPEKADRLAAELILQGVDAAAVDDLAKAVPQADVISCATLSTAPLILGDWLRPGQHLDLVGGFRPDMREADDRALRRAELFVDTRAGVLKEAGDIVDPLARDVIRESDIRADLFDLCRRKRPGRADPMAITLFKSVGTALEDLAAAVLAFERAQC